MKYALLFLLLINVFCLQANELSKEHLLGLFAGVDTPLAAAQVSKIAQANPSLVEAIIRDEQPIQIEARSHALIEWEFILASDAISTERYLDACFFVLKNQNRLVPRQSQACFSDFILRRITNLGNKPTQEIPFYKGPLTSVNSFLLCINLLNKHSLLFVGSIPGDLTSLFLRLRKLSVAPFDRVNAVVLLLEIRMKINQLRGAINPIGFKVITAFMQNLFTQLNPE